MLRRIGKKINEVGFFNFVKGLIRNNYYKKLQKEYCFDSWHESPYEWRKYAQTVCNYINEKKAGTVVDMGCGLGEVIRNSKANKRIGYDPSKEAIEAAKVLDRSKTIDYKIGSFGEFVEEGEVDYFITLGFMHGCEEEVWRSAYHRVSNRCCIHNFIVDVLPKDGKCHQLDFTKILPENYSIKERIGPFLGRRYIEIYEKKR